MISISASSSAYAAASDSYMELLQKRLETIKKNAEAIDQLSTRSSLEQKSAARQRVEEIKKEIEALRRMLSLFGVGKDAKAILQQLKQLANQLKQAANILRTPAESSVPDTPAAVSTDESAPAADVATTEVYDEGRSAYAEQQASAEADKVTVQVAPFDAQRFEDEKSLNAADQALKGLRAWLERKVKQQEHRI